LTGWRNHFSSRTIKVYISPTIRGIISPEDELSHIFIGFAPIPQAASETSGDPRPLGDFATDHSRLTATRQTLTTHTETTCHKAAALLSTKW